VQAVEELPPVRRRETEPRDPAELRARSERLVAEFVEAVVEARSTVPAAAAAAHAHG
jgi:hypothetical protein